MNVDTVESNGMVVQLKISNVSIIIVVKTESVAYWLGVTKGRHSTLFNFRRTSLTNLDCKETLTFINHVRITQCQNLMNSSALASLWNLSIYCTNIHTHRVLLPCGPKEILFHGQ